MMRLALNNTVALTCVVLALALAGGCAISAADPEAKKAFMRSLGNTSITVFPAFVRNGEPPYDENAAMSISELLTDEGLAEVTVSREQVLITGSWHHNQAKMLRESAAEFAEYLKANPTATKYALLPEYLAGDCGVGGIHCYIIDADNRLAFVVLQNSHWPIFAEMKPKTIDDCTDVLIEVLRESLKPSGADD